MDISDDILLANGNINEIQDGLKNLDTSVKATIESLSLRQETFEHGLDSSIKNYISTNKNAVLKIGLDYSIWALGSAGITMVNPNATYDFDPITGNYSVNPDTVGDGDEYIALQGSKIAINTYNREWLVDEEDGKEKEYQEIIATTINPALWKYDANGSIYVPKANKTSVFFIRGYVESLEGLQIVNIPQTEETTEILKYANFIPSDIKKSQVLNDTILGFVANDEITSTSEVYSFTNYYIDTKGSNKIKVRKEVNGETTMVSLLEYTSATTIYFVPRLEQTGLFSNGKFNSKFIEAENLVAVDVDDKTYIKNRRFDPKEEIKDTNYPVLNAKTNKPAKEANFVVVSGTTGKLTAKGADIRGSITIGDHENVDDTYVAISDNKGINKIEDEPYPALYILKSQGLNKSQILAKFSGAQVNNVQSLYSSVQTRTIDRAIPVSLRATYVVESTLQSETVIHGNNNEGIIIPSKPELDSDFPIIGEDTKPGNTPRVTYYWYSCYYRTLDNTTTTADVVYDKTSKEIITEFMLGPNEAKTLAFTGNILVKGNAPRTNHRGDLYLRGGLYVVNTQNPNQKTTIKAFTESASGTYELTINDTIVLDFSNTSTIVKNTNGQYSATYKIILELNQTYLNNWITEKSTNSNTIKPDADNLTISSSVTLNANYTIKEGGDGYVANFFGNGVAIGFNALNSFFAYYKSASESWSQDQMLISFKSNGVGMSFENGTFYNHIADHRMPGYIPILVGSFRYYQDYYHFDGRSLINNGSVGYYGNQITMKYSPYYSNHDDKNRGRIVNVGSDSLDDDTLYKCMYYSQHDIYVVRLSSGIITILFGNLWNTVFSGDKIFVRDNTLKISVVGIGRNEWNGLTSGSNHVPIATLYVTAKPAIYSINDKPICIDDSTRPTLFNSSGNSSYSVTYDKISTNTPDFYNALCLYLSDDSSLNDGSFYITLEVCANSVVK